jgi:hypothetical protein
MVVIASEAKQSISQREGRMDCFVASLLAMTWMEPDSHEGAFFDTDTNQDVCR